MKKSRLIIAIVLILVILASAVTISVIATTKSLAASDATIERIDRKIQEAER